MACSLTHTINVQLSRKRAAEAVAWVFDNVTEPTGMNIGPRRGGFSGRIVEGTALVIEFTVLDDAAKFRMLFGDDEDNFA